MILAVRALERLPRVKLLEGLSIKLMRVLIYLLEVFDTVIERLQVPLRVASHQLSKLFLLIAVRHFVIEQASLSCVDSLAG